MAKAAKGSVSVQAVRGRLRLRWRVEGEPYVLSLGYPDEPKYQRVAVLKAQEIERDILYDRFDPTLEKYRGRATQEESEGQQVLLDESVSRTGRLDMANSPMGLVQAIAVS